MQLKTLAALLATILTVQAATLPQTPTHIYNVVLLPLAGLFLPDFGGVLQPVLSGGTGQWSINNTWYYAITEDPAGQQDGDDVRFNMQKNDTWSITLSVPGTTKVATNSFPMIGHIPYAVFEIELWDQVWDFGPLTFTDITI
ncbi:hypothetical protein B0H13DRAFT_2109612, partial [Mycena leptocephala]